jgi:hypothetical protein
MLPHCKRDSQFELFDSAPAHAEPTPRLALPFQRSATIDKTRLGSILKISDNTARRMILRGEFRAYEGPKGWCVEYDSVIAYCNRLRVHYRISDTMIERPKHGRLRDRDILPFPWDETVDMAYTIGVLDCSAMHVLRLIDEGKLIAYQIQIDRNGCPWRIHRPSLEKYLATLSAQADAKAQSYRINRPSKGVVANQMVGSGSIGVTTSKRLWRSKHL